MRVVHYANDFDIGGRSGIGADADVASDGQTGPEIFVHEAGVHHGHSRRGAIVPGVKDSPREQMHSHGFEIAGADTVEMWLHHFSARSAIAFHGDAAIETRSGQHAHRRQSSRVDAGYRFEALLQSSIEGRG